MQKHIAPVDLTRCYRLLNHSPVVLITANYGNQSNVMSAAWITPLDANPPKIVLIMDSKSYTRELIEASGKLALNIPTSKIANKVLLAGSMTGRGINKFEKTDLEYFPASRVGAPLIKDCAGWLECKLIKEPENQSKYDMFIVEVIAASSDERIFSNGRWHFNSDADRTIHYQSGGAFFLTGDVILCEGKK